MEAMPGAIPILSAMITPVVLILASGSLILTTSQRLGRVIERARKLADRIKDLVRTNAGEATLENEIAVLFEQLHKNSRRAQLLQLSMACLYLTLSLFVATSIAIGLVDVADPRLVWIPSALGILGALVLFCASVLLILETRIALSAVNQEMDSAIRYVYNQFPSLNTERRSRHGSNRQKDMGHR